MRRATIVGAGMAGMSAALRLLERGFHVRMFEQDEFVGGMLHSYWDENTETMREHGYHMMPNFYFNFWNVVQDLGLQENFVPREGMKFLEGKNLDDLPSMYNPSGPQDFLRNLTGRAEPPPDLFIYMYSMIDILSQPMEDDDKLDDISVTGFLQGRPYMTDSAMALHKTMWQTVWGISSDQASMKSYRAFIKYSNRYSVPEFWFLAGNKWDHLIKPWLTRLEEHGDRFELHNLQRLQRVEVDGGRVTKLLFQEVDRSPTVNVGSWHTCGEPYHVDVADDAVIFAVTPGALKGLVHGELFEAAPSLGKVQYLSAVPIGNLQLRLTKRLTLPSDITEFPDAPYSLTFLDFTQIWRDLEHSSETLLNVSVSDPDELLSLEPERRDDNNELIIDLDAPKSALEFVLREVHKRLPFDLSHVDRRRTVYDVLTGEELFANMAGSWSRRPDTATPLSNLWLAGTFVKNVIDVATIEGAVMTGAMAAEAVRQNRAPDKPPITVLEPDEFPVEMYQALLFAWTPFVAVAKMWSMTNSFLGKLGPGWDQLQQQVIAAGAHAVKPYLGRTPDPPEYIGPMKWPGTERNLPDDDPRAIGPVYWLYNADGTRKKGT